MPGLFDFSRSMPTPLDRGCRWCMVALVIWGAFICGFAAFVLVRGH